MLWNKHADVRTHLSLCYRPSAQRCDDRLLCWSPKLWAASDLMTSYGIHHCCAVVKIGFVSGTFWWASAWITGVDEDSTVLFFFFSAACLHQHSRNIVFHSEAVAQRQQDAANVCKWHKMVFVCVQPDESSLDFSSCILRHGIKNAKELACGVCLLNVDARSKVRARRPCSKWPPVDTLYQPVHMRSRRLISILTLEHLQNKEESAIGRLFKRVWDSQLSNKSLSLWGRILAFTIKPDGWPKWQDSFLSISSLLPFDRQNL